MNESESVFFIKHGLIAIGTELEPVCPRRCPAHLLTEDLQVDAGAGFDNQLVVNVHFLVPKDRALTESTNDELKSKYASLTPEAIEGLKRYPAIFADENHSYGKTDDAQDAYFGFVKDVKIQDNGIKIYYTIITAIPQQILNEQCFELGIGGARSFNELNRTHWALKQINLIEALQKAGVQII